MKWNPSSRNLISWVGAVLIALTVAVGMVEAVRVSREYNYTDVLATEAKRRAMEVTGKTLNGNIMGSVANLGLVNQAMKQAALGTVPPQAPVVMNTLQAVGKLYKASGVFIVERNGTVLSSWDSGGKSSAGLDVRFRPYFQIAMKGE